MAMKIANNMSAINSLNILGQNDNALSKDLERLSTGMKLIHAGDDTSGYTIAQRMRAMIKGLDQCSSNVNTGYNMLKTAAEAVECQLDILKKMRDITLKASDDAYSQKDRDVLAIEIEEMFTQLNLIAEETTYNGKTLLNHRVGAVQNVTRISNIREFAPFDPTLEQVDNTTIGDIFTPNGNTQSGRSSRWPITGLKPTNYPPYLTLDFSNALAGHTVKDFDMQGFSVMCDGCEQFVSVVFDAERALGSGERQASINSSYSQCRQYIIGLKGARNADDIANAVYNGILAANSAFGDPGNLMGKHSLQIQKQGNQISIGTPTNSVLPVFYNGIKGASSTVEVTSTTTAVAGFNPWEDKYIQSGTKANEKTMIRLWNTSLDALFPGEDSLFLLEPEKSPTYYNPAEMPDPDEYPERYEGYAGTNDEKKAQLWRDEVWHMTKAGANNKSDAVRTREGASRFLKDIDQAIKYVLHVSTDFGAQMMRMEINAANISISQRSVQASESTITDADMAKEIVGFARDKLLVSSSQSMLAQANHQSENVLGLLA